MSAEETGFLDDIAANPDLDGPRLIFADWCEDNGQVERAEFIRMQIASGVTFPNHYLPGEHYLQQVYLERHFEQWMYPLPSLLGLNAARVDFGFLGTFDLLAQDTECSPGGFAVSWRRGFIEAIHCEYRDWVLYGCTLCDCLPLTRVRFHHWGDMLTSGMYRSWTDDGPDTLRWYWQTQQLESRATGTARLLDEPTLAGRLSRAVYQKNYADRYEGWQAISDAAIAWARGK